MSKSQNPSVDVHGGADAPWRLPLSLNELRYLFLLRPSWNKRRVEHLKYKGDSVWEHSVSFTLSWKELYSRQESILKVKCLEEKAAKGDKCTKCGDCSRPNEQLPFLPVPLCVLPKSSLIAFFDIRDRCGNPLELLTRPECAHYGLCIVVGALESAARRGLLNAFCAEDTPLLFGYLYGDVFKKLTRFVESNNPPLDLVVNSICEDFKKFLSEIRSKGEINEDEEKTETRLLESYLKRVPDFKVLLYMFAQNWLPVVEIENSRQESGIIKFKYNETWDLDSKNDTNWLLTFHGKSLSKEINTWGSAEHEHLTIYSPEGTAFTTNVGIMKHVSSTEADSETTLSRRSPESIASQSAPDCVTLRKEQPWVSDDSSGGPSGGMPRTIRSERFWLQTTLVPELQFRDLFRLVFLAASIAFALSIAVLYDASPAYIAEPYDYASMVAKSQSVASFSQRMNGSPVYYLSIIGIIVGLFLNYAVLREKEHYLKKVASRFARFVFRGGVLLDVLLAVLIWAGYLFETQSGNAISVAIQSVFPYVAWAVVLAQLELATFYSIWYIRSWRQARKRSCLENNMQILKIEERKTSAKRTVGKQLVVACIVYLIVLDVAVWVAWIAASSVAPYVMPSSFWSNLTAFFVVLAVIISAVTFFRAHATDREAA